MGAEFGKETLNIKIGQNVIDALNKALEKKGQADRMDNENGLFFISDITVLSIKDNEVECMVEYEYGG